MSRIFQSFFFFVISQISVTSQPHKFPTQYQFLDDKRLLISTHFTFSLGLFTV